MSPKMKTRIEKLEKELAAAKKVGLFGYAESLQAQIRNLRALCEDKADKAVEK